MDRIFDFCRGFSRRGSGTLGEIADFIGHDGETRTGFSGSRGFDGDGLASRRNVVVEAGIALSIIYVATENLFTRRPQGRWIVSFLFGLVHGFGFAGVLKELALPSSALVASLITFNVGVEVAQVARRFDNVIARAHGALLGQQVTTSESQTPLIAMGAKIKPTYSQITASCAFANFGRRQFRAVRPW